MDKNMILKARTSIVLEQPFFASIMMRLPMVEDKEFPAPMGTNGKYIKYNPELIKEWSLDEIKGVICHEVMHVAHGHALRMQDRDHSIWNIACDYVINGVIDRVNSMRLPDGGLVDHKYDNMSSEHVYAEVYQDAKSGKYGKLGGDSDNGSPYPEAFDVVEPYPGENGEQATSADIQKAEMDRVVMLKQAIMAAKKCGHIPAGMEELVDNLVNPKVPWRQVLADFVTKIAKNDFSWKMPNKRYLYGGMYLPSLNSPEIGNIAILVDTSGSVSADEMKTMVSEIQGIVSMFKTTVDIVWVDAEIQGHDTIEADDTPEFTRHGCGGTSFVPGFEYVDEKQLDPVCAIYLTDGECNDFPVTPEYPVLWALTHEPSYVRWEPPFGKTLVMED